MAPTGPTIAVSAPSEKEIAAYPRQYALFRQLDHSHKGQIPLEVGAHTCSKTKTKVSRLELCLRTLQY